MNWEDDFDLFHVKLFPHDANVHYYVTLFVKIIQ